MFVILVLGLILRVAILRMPSALGIGSQSGSQQLAKTSAESGLEYAKAQLREDPTWKGGTSRLVVIDQPGLKVVSEQGNVIGTLTDPRGVTSEFRLRFNFQDGSDSPVGTNAPTHPPNSGASFPISASTTSKKTLRRSCRVPREIGPSLWILCRPLQHSPSLGLLGGRRSDLKGGRLRGVASDRPVGLPSRR